MAFPCLVAHTLARALPLSSSLGRLARARAAAPLSERARGKPASTPAPSRPLARRACLRAHTGPRPLGVSDLVPRAAAAEAAAAHNWSQRGAGGSSAPMRAPSRRGRHFRVPQAPGGAGRSDGLTFGVAAAPTEPVAPTLVRPKARKEARRSPIGPRAILPKSNRKQVSPAQSWPHSHHLDPARRPAGQPPASQPASQPGGLAQNAEVAAC